MLILGTCVSFAVFVLERVEILREAQRTFTAWSDERRDLLQRSLDAHMEVLHGVRALFDSSETVTANEFSRFTAAPLQRFPHLRSLDWLPRVPRERYEDFEQRATAELGRPYTISPKVGKDDASSVVDGALWPVLYSQSRDPALRIGLNDGADPARAAAMTSAARANRATLAVVARTAPNTGRFQLYLPVFENGARGRVPVPEGFVRTTFNVDRLLRGLLGEATSDGAAIALLDARTQTLLASLEPTEVGSASGALEWSGPVQFGDRTLLLRFTGTPLYAGYPRLGPTYALLAACLTVTALGALAVYHLTQRRLRLQQLTRELLAEVAERRASEERLSQSETRYRALVENSPDAIMINQDDQVRFVNPACIRLLGASSADEIVGRSIFDFVLPEERNEVRDRLNEMRRRMSVLPSAERRLLRLDGSVVEVESLVVPYRTDEGVLLHVTSRDITKRREVEAERTALEAALRQSQKLEALGTLSGGIAHDFNNILSAILGNTRLLQEEFAHANPAGRHLEEIRNATHRARDLVKRLMAFSREQESQRTAIPLTPLFVEVQQLLRATLPAGVELTAHVAPNTPAIHADATQIHQVLLNLCTNAWQAMRSKVGRIEMKAHALSGEDAVAHSGAVLDPTVQYVCITVQDNGSGMSADTMEHIFDPFFTTKQPGEGSGLGLAVVHGIVQSHQGAIAVTSELDVGTTFHIYLPATDATPVAPSAAPQADARGAAQHILYIDDEEPLVFLAMRMLERAGFRCSGHTEAAQAIEAMRRDPNEFDLVITDLNMPGMSGLDVARELLAIRPDLPIVITTGYVRTADINAAREIGVRDVMLKPDTIDELARSVQKYLS